MKKETLFTGVSTALVTPFRDGRVDFDALGGLIDLQLKAGIPALTVCGTTGESPTLDMREQREIISFAKSMVGERAIIIAGAGSNSTRHACELARNAACSGADAILSVTPYYNKCNTAGLVLHYSAVANASGLPVIVYNVPSRTGMGLTPEQYERLAGIDGIVAVKEAGRDIGTAVRAMKICGDALDFYSGNDDLTLALMAHGAKGVISVASNALPKEMTELTDAFSSGFTDRAREIFEQLLPTFDYLSSDINPIPIKTMLAEKGSIKKEFRLPLFG